MPRPFQTPQPPIYQEQSTPNQGEEQYQTGRQGLAVEEEKSGYPYQQQPTPEFNIPTRTDQPPQSSPYPKVYHTQGYPTIDTPTSTLAAQTPKTVAGLPSVDDGFLQSDRSTTSAPPYDAGQSVTTTGNEIDSDASQSHPPHIHDIRVECSKDSMTIQIEFNRRFDGVIYSKGYYNTPACRHVSPDSGQTKYNFTVMLNSCGTQFVDEFSQGKQAYLENVLVLQNEIGIQEVWDSVRSVRCLWEGNLNKALSVALSVGMLNQEVVTFSGDTATARLDIQMGRGPFAPSANGLVKIGEPMTLVVTVEGDPAFNVLVRECTAKDNDPESGNLVKLTDDDGCILKPKLMGAFQTARNPDTNLVIAYAFFNAFKFPDIMDLTIECNIELCKTECKPCSIADQGTEPGRRRRRDADQNSVTYDLSNNLKLMLSGYPVIFSHHPSNETKLGQNIVASVNKLTPKSEIHYRLLNSNDELLSKDFINFDPIVVNRQFMVYAPGDILTSEHVRQVTSMRVQSDTNEKITICLTPLSYFSVAVALITTLALSCGSCIMLWQRKRAKTVF
ncbi:uncharacterized protein LOC120355083 isoform X2 [Nilaparvata lugens]|nr:uncharacterized protein LOC120355083 isoform X2 [Nilaparvata lugens]